MNGNDYSILVERGLFSMGSLLRIDCIQSVLNRQMRSPTGDIVALLCETLNN